jgi:hypothetical protein
MALLNFPADPTTGDLFSIGAVVWQWNGYAWIRYNSVQITQTSTNITNVVVLTTTTNSTGTNSGALVVDGGAGIGGHANIGGDTNIGGDVHILSTTASTSTTTGALVVDGGVGIAKDLRVGGNFTVNDNTDNQISITAGSAGIEVGNPLRTTAGPAFIDFHSFNSNNDYDVRLRVDSGAAFTDGAGSLTVTSADSTFTGSLSVASNVGVGADLGVGGNVTVQGRVNSESLRLADAILDSTLVVTTASTATVVIDSYSISQFRSAKYLVQIDEGTGPTDRCQVAEILLIVNNAGVVAATEYANLFPDTDPAMGEFYAGYDVFDGSVKLYFTPYDATVKEIVVLRTGLSV